MQPVQALPAIEYAERSDPGRDPDKQVNEDACGRAETRFGHLCVVCDGMGGHAAGREAAELALKTIVEMFDSAADGTAPAEVLRAAVEEASRRVHLMPNTEVAMGRPGSTAVALLMHVHGTEIAHVGDSRCYLVHKGQIFRMTRDHSMVQELVDRGLLTPQQAAHHPDANRITRALGMGPDVEVELRSQPVAHVTGDAFVLCSDGLSDLVEDNEILAVVGGEPAAQAVGKLVDLANARGGHDNITVIVLRARETALTNPTSVSPTLPQTSAPHAAPVATAIAGDSGATPTLLESPLHPAAGVPLSAPSPPSTRATSQATGADDRPLGPTAPPSSRLARALRRRHPAVVAGLLLALAAVAILGAMLAEEVTERSGKRNATSPASRPEPAHGDAAAAVALADAMTTLAPDPIVIPPPTTPTEPIAPLEPPIKPAPTKGKHAEPPRPKSD
ncbi:MAG: protein phosphatase 2C domain-containing protein [Myxococcota bacterium]|nr:protein phosphatase 2C domain-containing protein [Myxococcota bacterium]